MWEHDRAHQVFTFGRSLSCSHNSCRFSSPDTLQLSWLNLSDVWNVMSSLKMRLDKNNCSSDSIRWIYHWLDKRGIVVMERSGGLDIVMSVVEMEQIYIWSGLAYLYYCGLKWTVLFQGSKDEWVYWFTRCLSKSTSAHGPVITRKNAKAVHSLEASSVSNFIFLFFTFSNLFLDISTSTNAQ